MSDAEHDQRGELHPDPTEPHGGTPEDREHAERIEEHSRQTTEPTEDAATRPASGT